MTADNTWTGPTRLAKHSQWLHYFLTQRIFYPIMTCRSKGYLQLTIRVDITVHF